MEPLGPSEPAVFGPSLGASSPVPAGLPLVLAGEVPLPVEASPGERALSRTAFAGDGREAAVSLAERIFGVATPGWRSPQSEGVGRITRYIGDSEADETLPTGQKVLISSSIPLRSAAASGNEEPVSLTLRSEGGAYEEANPLVPVSISKTARGGVTFSAANIRVAPTLASEPEVSTAVGNGVFYPAVAPGTDFILEPMPLGVEASWQLLSQGSPESNSLTFALPPGASLLMSKTLEGAVEVVSEAAQPLLLIRPAVGTEADGSSLPVSYSINGDTLTTHVNLTGSVDFPVLVDPTISQAYGSSGYWAGWGTGSSGAGSYWEGGQGNAGILAGIEPKSPAATWTSWSVFAPGWETGEGSITRVDVTGMQHLYAKKSWLEAGFEHDDGTKPVWTYNGTELKDTESGALLTEKEYSKKDAAFCAEGEGGTDGKSPGLCDEAYGAGDFHLTVFTSASQATHQSAMIEATTVKYLDTSHMSTSFASGSTVDGQPNVLYGGGSWLTPAHGAFEYTASDPAFGVASTGLQIYHGGKWEAVQSTGYTGCNSFKCPNPESTADDYNNFANHLPEGEYPIKASGADLAGVGTEVESVVKVDASAPTMTASGLPKTGETFELTETEAHLKAEATDGTGSNKSSGVAWIALYIDGHEVESKRGSCTPGPCTASGEWALNGAELGAGYHTLEIQSEDYAGNISEPKTYGLTVYHSNPVALAPGSVNLQSGDFALNTTDVSFDTGTGVLEVTRHYDSRNVKEGEGGTLGPQWTIGLAEAASVEELPNGSVMLIDSEGLTAFTKSGSEYVAPTGDSSLALTYANGKYKLEDKVKGTTTEFSLPANAPTGSKLWLATATMGPGATSEITDAYESVSIEGKPVTEPILELAPHPSLSCPPEESKWESWQTGCRGLFFEYTHTQEGAAKGEQETEWGTYVGRLSEIDAVAYNPATAKMQKTPVARYSYDSKGRLRAEWNPATGLKTIYGYDGEGHITAVTPPGEEPWILTYGSIEGDESTGRIIKVDRLTASASLWEGHLPESTEAPKIAGSPIVGNLMSVSTGKWAHGAVGYAYYWEECSVTGGECARIQGATNPTYKPTSNVAGHELVAQVAAINSGGSTVASSTASGVVTTQGTATEGEQVGPAPGAAIEYNVPISGTGAPYPMGASSVKEWGEETAPSNAAAVFAPESERGWPASSYAGATVYYINGQGQTVNVAAPTGGISTTEYNKTNNVKRTLSAANREKALHEGNPITAAELLSTSNTYNSEGTELTETLGPLEKVRLPGGTEVEARERKRYTYEQGAPKGEEGHDLVTTETAGALLGLTKPEEVDVRTTTKSYSGQNNLGWKLRQPTSVTVDPAGLHLTTTTEYTESGEVETTSPPAGNSQAAYPPVYQSAFDGQGQFALNEPQGIAVDSSGDVWVADQNNNRLEKFSSAGTFLESYGSLGSGNEQFNEPSGVAINETTGDVYVSDFKNNRIQELTLSGQFVARFGTSGEGAVKEPTGIAVDEAGDVWVADYGHHRVVEFSATGSFMRAVGTAGTGPGQFEEPWGIALVGGDVYVSDISTDRVQKFSGTGVYLSTFGSKGSGAGQFEGGAWGIAVAPVTDDLYVADAASRVEEFSPAGEYLGEYGVYGSGSTRDQVDAPAGIAVGTSGEVYVANEGSDDISAWLPPGTGGTRMLYSNSIGTAGTGNGQFKYPMATAIDGHGNLWVTDYEDDRVEKFSSTGTFIAAYGKLGSGSTELKEPIGVAVNKSTGNVYIGDCGNSRIQELSETGEFIRSWGHYGSETGAFDCPTGVQVDSEGHVWVTDTYNNRIQEFSANGTFIAAYGSAGSGHEQFSEPEALVFADGNLYVADSSNNRVEELTTSGTFVRAFGIQGNGSGEFEYPEGIAADPAGNIYVSDRGNNRIEEFSPTGSFLGEFGVPGKGTGQLSEPHGIAINASGDLYVADSGNSRVQEWIPERQAAHDTHNIYYSAAANIEAKECGEHPEWVGLLCQTGPVAQPDDTIAPSLPTTVTKYNFWDQAETTTTIIGSAARTTHTTFDEAGRPLTTEQIACTGYPSECKPTGDTALPKVTDTYNAETGQMHTQSTDEGKEETITSEYNRQGALVAYTDANGAKTTYTYDAFGRLETVATEKGSQTYKYEEGTDFLSMLTDSKAGTFTAKYNVEGQLLTEHYPNGMEATYSYNPVGLAVSLVYKKLTYCSTGCEWYTDTRVPSIHDETTLEQTSLAHLVSTYDAAGRLTEVQETPTGQGCTTRLYTYNEDSDRTSLTARAPNSKGECTTEGGTTEPHHYDEGDRLIDEGVQYEPFDNVTVLPAADAGGHELTTSYYIDGQAASQTQKSATEVSNSLEYKLDPEDRTLETISKGEKPGTTMTHYAGPGDAVAWTSEGGEHWTRDIPGIGGELTATESGGAQPILLLHDLQGDIVAEAARSETETKLLGTYQSTEFGVPNSSKPPTYNWLGALGVKSELPSGAIAQDGATYVPQLGGPLQTARPELPADVNTQSTGLTFPMPPVTEGAAHQEANAEQECTGMKACAASRHEGTDEYHEVGDKATGCSDWASWGTHNVLGQLTVWGHIECDGPVADDGELQFEMQVALFWEGHMVGESPGEHVTSVDGEPAEIHQPFACPSEKGTFRAWFWGRLTGGVRGARVPSWRGWGYEARTLSECRDPLGNAETPRVGPPDDGG